MSILIIEKVRKMKQRKVKYNTYNKDLVVMPDGSLGSKEEWLEYDKDGFYNN